MNTLKYLQARLNLIYFIYYNIINNYLKNYAQKLAKCIFYTMLDKLKKQKY